MELKTKYQYTYFIYPYVIKESKYNKYLLKLLKDKKCNLKFFEKEKDLDIYSYFLPTVRSYMFPTFEFNAVKKRRFEELDVDMKAAILKKHSCVMFEYDVGDSIQGKAGEKYGIFFKIEKIEIICFHTGICFLNIKTNIENSNEFSDVLNFNYKFKEINSELKELKEFENIRLQTDSFQDIQELSELIHDITGEVSHAKEFDIDTNRFLTYSYTCIDQEDWNSQNNFDDISHEFFKYSHVLPSTYNLSFDQEKDKQNLKVLSKWKYVRHGFSKMGATLFSSSVDTINYTKLPFSYENEYLYTYILAMYQKIYLRKLIMEFKGSTKSEEIRKMFIKFTQSLWIHEVTLDEVGSEIYSNWKEVLELDSIYFEVKNKYDVLYKEMNIEKTAKTNKIIAIILVTSLFINIVNFLVLWLFK